MPSWDSTSWWLQFVLVMPLQTPQAEINVKPHCSCSCIAGCCSLSDNYSSCTSIDDLQLVWVWQYSWPRWWWCWVIGVDYVCAVPSFLRVHQSKRKNAWEHGSKSMYLYLDPNYLKIPSTFQYKQYIVFNQKLYTVLYWTLCWYYTLVSICTLSVMML